MHYNQTPDGWNGFAIVSEFYNNYNPNDRRYKNGDSQIITSFGNPGDANRSNVQARWYCSIK
jgi:hypothetical protein